MSITNTKLWPTLKPYFYTENCKDTTGNTARVRIEVRAMPAKLDKQARALTMPCVACGAPVHPIRQREKGGRTTPGKMYYSPTCPLDVNVGCSRGSAARDEYDHMRKVI